MSDPRQLGITQSRYEVLWLELYLWSGSRNFLWCIPLCTRIQKRTGPRSKMLQEEGAKGWNLAGGGNLLHGWLCFSCPTAAFHASSYAVLEWIMLYYFKSDLITWFCYWGEMKPIGEESSIVWKHFARIDPKKCQERAIFFNPAANVTKQVEKVSRKGSQYSHTASLYIVGWPTNGNSTFQPAETC